MENAGYTSNMSKRLGNTIAELGGDSMSNNPGCLGLILQALGILPKQSSNLDEGAEENITRKELPYALRDDFLSPAELSFYKVLQQAVGDKAVICTKVALKDLFFVTAGDRNEKTMFTNYIARKHVDFVLCTKETIKPICGIELDDSSHQRKDRVKRDSFVEKVFDTAKLPLIRYRNKWTYTLEEIIEKLTPILDTYEGRIKADSDESLIDNTGLDVTQDKIPICKKCGIPMVLRMSSRGSNKGQSFYGCSNYPQCRETIKV